MAFDWMAARKTLDESGSNRSACLALAEARIPIRILDGRRSEYLPSHLLLSPEGPPGNLPVRHPRWFDWQGEKGGVGPVSLVAHATGWSEQESLEWVVNHVKLCPVAAALGEALALHGVAGPSGAMGVAPRM